MRPAVSSKTGQRARSVPATPVVPQPVVAASDQGEGGVGDGTIVPYADVLERTDTFEIAADVPGVVASGVVVHIDHSTLTIEAAPGPLGEIDEASALHREFSLMPYRRSFTLPREIDRESVVATVRDGVLRVTLRKAPVSRARTIAVQAD